MDIALVPRGVVVWHSDIAFVVVVVVVPRYVAAKIAVDVPQHLGHPGDEGTEVAQGSIRPPPRVPDPARSAIQQMTRCCHSPIVAAPTTTPPRLDRVPEGRLRGGGVIEGATRRNYRVGRPHVVVGRHRRLRRACGRPRPRQRRRPVVLPLDVGCQEVLLLLLRRFDVVIGLLDRSPPDVFRIVVSVLLHLDNQIFPLSRRSSPLRSSFDGGGNAVVRVLDRRSYSFVHLLLRIPPSNATDDRDNVAVAIGDIAPGRGGGWDNFLSLVILLHHRPVLPAVTILAHAVRPTFPAPPTEQPLQPLQIHPERRVAASSFSSSSSSSTTSSTSSADHSAATAVDCDIAVVAVFVVIVAKVVGRV